MKRELEVNMHEEVLWRERESVCVCVIITYLYCIVQHCIMIVLIVPFIRWKGEVSVGY